MAVKISELGKFNELELGDGRNLLIPASKGTDTTKTINVKELVDHVVSNSTHEQEQETKLNEHETKISNVENIDVWDLTTFH